MLSITTYYVIHRADEEARHAEAERRVATHTNVLQGLIDGKLQQLRFAQILFAAAFDPVEFRRFARDISNDVGGVRAVTWLPRVPGETRDAFEAAARWNGQTHFRIHEFPDAGGETSPAREVYFPILHVEPAAGNEAMIGVDIASRPDRRETLLKSIATGSLSVTPATMLVGPLDDGILGVIAFVPIFPEYGTDGAGSAPQQHLASGIVAATYPIGQFLEAALAMLKPAGGLDIYLTERDADGQERLIYFHPSRTRAAPIGPASLARVRQGWFEESKIRFGDRTWNAVFAPVDAVYPRRDWPADLALGLGLLLTFLVALYAHRAATEQERVAQLVVERTGELSQVNADLQEKIVRLKSAEQALRDTQLRQQQFAESASDLFWETDAEIRFTWVSSRFAEVTGFPVEWFAGRTPWAWACVDPDLHPEWRLLRDIVRACHPFRDFDCTVQNADGTIRHVRMNGRPHFDGTRLLGYRGTATDITEQVVSRLAAEREHQHLLQAMSSVPDGVALFDVDDRLVFCNDRYRQLFADVADKIRPGMMFESLLRVSAERGFAEEAAGRPEAWIADRLAARRECSSSPVELRRGGRLIELRRHRTPDGSVYSVLVDITDSRRQEEQLRQSQKMEAVGTFAGGIAHEFNNILGIIRGYADLARVFTPADSPVRGHVTKIIKSIERASAVTKALLAFSRKRAPETKVLDLARLVEEQRFLLKPLLKPNIDLEIHSDRGPHHVRVDPDLFAQAIMNLAINARDAMPDGGRFRIAVEAAGDDGAATPAPHSVRMTLSDSGIGMDAETARRIFEPFFTTKGQGKGTGLGLSMVYGVVTEAGGSIKVETEPGRGTSFTIHLPAVDAGTADESADAAGAGAEGRPIRTAGRTVLLAEDEPMMRTLLTEALTMARYRVLAAADGEEALELFDANRIDVLVTDVVMPELDGVRLAGLLTDIRPDLPVIYITGVPGRGASDSIEIPESATVLFKPFPPSQLIQIVDAALGAAPAQPQALEHVP